MEFVKLIPINRICPCCGNGNYMRIISGKYVGELNVKCINCNSYYNYDELLKRDNSKPLNEADGRTMDDLISRAEAINTVKSMLYQTAINSIESNEDAAKIYDDIATNRIHVWLGLVDAAENAPVVRCKDCEFYGEEPYGTLKECYRGCGWTEPIDYCSRGKRRESE